MEPVFVFVFRTTDLARLTTKHLSLYESAQEQALSFGHKKGSQHIFIIKSQREAGLAYFADFGNYLIKVVRPLYIEIPIPNIDIKNEISALDSTAICLIINLLTRAEGKYSRGAVKMHTQLDLRGSIYLMDKAYVDFEAL